MFFIFNTLEPLSEHKRLTNLNINGTYQGEPGTIPTCCTTPRQPTIKYSGDLNSGHLNNGISRRSHSLFRLHWTILYRSKPVPGQNRKFKMKEDDTNNYQTCLHETRESQKT